MERWRSVSLQHSHQDQNQEKDQDVIRKVLTNQKKETTNLTIDKVENNS